MGTQAIQAEHAADTTPTDAHPSLLARSLVMLVGLGAYASFLATILYAIGFVGGWIVPKGIDDGAAAALAPALVINTLLLCLFVGQHTIMARRWFKAWWTTIVPRAIERSVFVLASAGALGLLFWQWRPLPDIVWAVETPWAAWTLTGLSLLGWAIVFAASMMVSHADLFGLRQTWLAFVGKAERPIAFRITGLYKLVRHPLMTGFMIAFWATPTMTVGHLFFAAMVTGYIILGTKLEERDLIAAFGDRYRNYRKQVPGLLPIGPLLRIVGIGRRA